MYWCGQEGQRHGRKRWSAGQAAIRRGADHFPLGKSCSASLTIRYQEGLICYRTSKNDKHQSLPTQTMIRTSARGFLFAQCMDCRNASSSLGEQRNMNASIDLVNNNLPHVRCSAIATDALLSALQHYNALNRRQAHDACSRAPIAANDKRRCRRDHGSRQLSVTKLTACCIEPPNLEAYHQL